MNSSANHVYCRRSGPGHLLNEPTHDGKQETDYSVYVLSFVCFYLLLLLLLLFLYSLEKQFGWFLTHKSRLHRARKLYTSARIYEWKFGKGEWKLPFASPTGRVDFFGFTIIFWGKKELTSMFYSLQKHRKHSEERSSGRFKMSLTCDRMFTLVQ